MPEGVNGSVKSPSTNSESLPALTVPKKVLYPVGAGARRCTRDFAGTSRRPNGWGSNSPGKWVTPTG